MACFYQCVPAETVGHGAPHPTVLTAYGRHPVGCFQFIRAPQRIKMGAQASLFDSGLRQDKAALASTEVKKPFMVVSLILATKTPLFVLGRVCGGVLQSGGWFILILEKEHG